MDMDYSITSLKPKQYVQGCASKQEVLEACEANTEKAIDPPNMQPVQ